ncbi:MAG: PfkB family carbohydrate kinase [Conexivisphaerales archaeon]
MKVRLLGHLTFDDVTVIDEKGTNIEYESVGGPPIYSGLLLAKLGLEPFIHTRYGPDFEGSRLLWLTKNGLTLSKHSASASSMTTRFRIQVNKKSGERELYLVSRCEDINLDDPEFYPRFDFDADSDVCLVQPVFREVSPDILKGLRERCSYLFLDPQGFLRKSVNGRIALAENRKLAGSLASLDGIKVDVEEGYVLTGKREIAQIGRSLVQRGVKEVIVTAGGSGTYLFTERLALFISLPKTDLFDGIGAGDMLGAGYAFARQSMDFSDSLAFAVACAISRIDRRALDKIPTQREIETMMTQLLPRMVRVA